MQERSVAVPGAKTINMGDAVFRSLAVFFAGLIIILVGVMVYEMYINSTLSIEKFGWQFFVNSAWDPVSEEYGALPFVYGTLVTSALALLIAVPLSLGIAIFLSEIAPPWLERPASVVVELLAGIPSIVYGLWGFFVMVPWLRSAVQPFLTEHLGFLPLFQGVP